MPFIDPGGENSIYGPRACKFNGIIDRFIDLLIMWFGLLAISMLGRGTRLPNPAPLGPKPPASPAPPPPKR